MRQLLITTTLLAAGLSMAYPGKSALEKISENISQENDEEGETQQQSKENNVMDQLYDKMDNRMDEMEERSGNLNRCTFFNGDVVGGEEEQLDNTNTEMECAALVKAKKSTATGASWLPSSKFCWAEFGDRIPCPTEFSSVYRSCLFKSVPPYFKFYKNRGRTEICRVVLGGCVMAKNKAMKKAFRCPNDKATSMKLCYAPKDTIIKIYDDPKLRTKDDWVEIKVKNTLTKCYTITTFEKNDDGEDVKISYGRKNGLNGKVSSFKFETGYDE